MSAASPDPMIAEVGALLERRRTAQAKARLKSALQQFPDNQELLLQSAWADYLDDGNENALATVRQVLVRNPSDRSARLLLFELTLEANDLAEAERIILGLLRDHPGHAPYYARYAQLMIRAMNVTKARALAREGLRLDPGESGGLAAETLCDFIEERSGAASPALHELLAREPASSRTMALIMVALQERGDLTGAYRIARELVRAQPDERAFVEAAAELKAVSHWSMLPLWPLQRWGWGASAAMWLAAVVGLRLVSGVSPAAAGVLGMGFLTYVVYSWVWPPLLRRWIARG